jgi:hypothetical protein
LAAENELQINNLRCARHSPLESAVLWGGARPVKLFSTTGGCLSPAAMLEAAPRMRNQMRSLRHIAAITAAAAPQSYLRSDRWFVRASVKRSEPGSIARPD